MSCGAARPTRKLAAVAALVAEGKSDGDEEQKKIELTPDREIPKTFEIVDLKLSNDCGDHENSVEFACQEGFCGDEFPLHTWMKTSFNINAKHGGGTALLLLSRRCQEYNYEAVGSELQLIRCGFDGNHLEATSLMKGGLFNAHHHHEIYTSPDGILLPAALLGNAHCCIISNIALMGNCGCAVVLEGDSTDRETSSESTTQLRLAPVCGSPGGCFVILCSAMQDDDEPSANIYFIHQGDSDDDLDAKPLLPDKADLWTFHSSEDSTGIEVKGPHGSHYAIHSVFSSELLKQHEDGVMGKVMHSQAYDGSKATCLLSKWTEHIGRTLLLMCSCSSGSENQTTSALYQITMKKSDVECSFLGGSSGNFESASVWKVFLQDDNLVVAGPAVPCRYGYISNIPEDITDFQKRSDQRSCLATAKAKSFRGGLELRDNTLLGWVQEPVPVNIWLNEKVICNVKASELLQQPDGRLGFRRQLTTDEMEPGLKLFRAFALVEDRNKSDVTIELVGSPLRTAHQPEGVHFAANLGGSFYESTDKVVFADTQSLFQSDPTKGYRCVRLHSEYIPTDTNLYSLMSNTDDGFLFTTCHKTQHYYQNARGISYDVDLPNGNYCVRVHCVSDGLQDQFVKINGVPYSKQVTTELSKITDVAPGLTAKEVTIPFTVEGGKVNVHFGTNLTMFLRCFPGAMAGATVNPEDLQDSDEDETSLAESSDKIPSCGVCALMIYDPTKYVVPVPSEEESNQQTTECLQLSDKLVALERTFQTKEIKIAGWSSNLLENASGETGDLTHWNVSGNWKTSKGGDQTETKFITSFMTCTKYQEVDLTRHFSESYLDTAPEIQASESFHEGCNNGGYYSFTVSLLTYDGEVVAKKTTGEIGSIKTHDWIRENFTFKDYGKGVRLVGFESMGRDDKYWAGHFGTTTSAAMVRVKTDTSPAENDAKHDVVEDKLSTDKIQEITKLIGTLNDEYREGLKEFEATVVGKDTDTLKSEPSNGATGTDKDKPASRQEVKKRSRKKREIRIFVSSTFVDFKDEREILIKKAFREVNRICLDRGVFFSYVDLRWGITSDQSKDGKTISICLREVERCRPYFICLLGDRFGWSQTEEKKDELLNKSYDFAIENFKALGWLEDFRFSTSVTKLEILHAALRKGIQPSNRTFFYLRSSRVQREELPKPEEAKRGENQWHFDQQHELRDQIKQSEMTSREFSSADEGCVMIKEDLIRCVNEDFPPGSQLSHTDREKEAHEAFADVRKRVYIGREEYFKSIDQHFDNIIQGIESNQPLVILGQSGSGKSALVANWCGRFEEKCPDDFLFFHFIGSSAESASHLNLLRRLYEELKIYLHQDLSVPSSDRNLVLELPTWLKLASNTGRRIMIVLDALNQLDSGAGSTGDEQDLKWLPKELPPNVHLLMSTLPGRAMDAVEQAGWPKLQVFPLNADEKLEIITGYMSLYAKTLNEEQTSLIIQAKQSNNPLYLKALLDEVRMYGSFEQLTTAIKSYLTADDPGTLFVKILERLEADFDHGTFPRPGLVRDATVAIWCSHRGKSEQELVNFLKVPSHIWSPFYLSLEENLVNRNGIVNFFHDYMRQAVEQKYLPTPEDKQKGYLALADFFRRQDIDDRYVDEMPFLLGQAGELTRLKATILNIAVFQRLMKTEEGKYQLIKSWHLLGGYEQVEEEYLKVLNRTDWRTVRDKTGLMRAMAGFFMQLGLLKGARLLLERLLKELEVRYFETDRIIVYHHANYSRRLRCNHPSVIDVLIELGTVCCKLGLPDTASDTLHDALTRQPKPKSPAQKLRLVRTMMAMATANRLLKKPDEAKKFLIRAQELATQVLGSTHHYVSAIIGQIGELSYGQGKLEAAILSYLYDLRLTQRDVGLDHPRVAAILNNIALVLDDMNNQISGELFQAVLAILVSAYGKDHVDVAIVRYNLGAFFLADNFFQKAEFQFSEALRIFQGFLGDHHPKTKATLDAIKML
ncbi:uncharacterized protein [Amphiura filiformis]|uniref:uncharacterized protein isoform X2 n=1 Tax=Amphiura filiformis TaxID=82378 RepID=UPI003B222929